MMEDREDLLQQCAERKAQRKQEEAATRLMEAMPQVQRRIPEPGSIALNSYQNMREWPSVYLLCLHDPETGSIATKIGVSLDPFERCHNLSREKRTYPYSRHVLEVFASMRCPAAYKIEQELHNHFADKMTENEWFSMHPAEALPILADKVRSYWV